MHRLVVLALLNLLAVTALSAPTKAADSDQFCQTATLMAEAAKADVGTWLDRKTRNDGIEVLCGIRTVHFRRFLNVSAANLDTGWKLRKEQEWNSVNCSDRVWRQAIENGWFIVTTITTPSGDRAAMLATCK